MGKVLTPLLKRVLIQTQSAQPGKEGEGITRVYDLTKATDAWADVMDGKLSRATLANDRRQTLFCLGHVWIVEDRPIRRNREIPSYFPLTPDRAAVWLVLNGYEKKMPKALQVQAMNVKA